jgi:hypothetical protein
MLSVAVKSNMLTVVVLGVVLLGGVAPNFMSHCSTHSCLILVRLYQGYQKIKKKLTYSISLLNSLFVSKKLSFFFSEEINNKTFPALINTAV